MCRMQINQSPALILLSQINSSQSKHFLEHYKKFHPSQNARILLKLLLSIKTPNSFIKRFGENGQNLTNTNKKALQNLFSYSFDRTDLGLKTLQYIELFKENKRKNYLWSSFDEIILFQVGTYVIQIPLFFTTPIFRTFTQIVYFAKKPPHPNPWAFLISITILLFFAAFFIIPDSKLLSRLTILLRLRSRGASISWDFQSLTIMRKPIMINLSI